MTFPAIADSDTTSGTVTSNSTSWTLTYPTNLAAGDLIAFVMATDGAPTVSTTEGFSLYSDATGTAVRWQVLLKIADGTETGTFTATISASEQGAWRGWRITSWFGSGLPNSTPITSSATANGTGVAIRSITGASTTPDPGSTNPSDWDIEDTLWLAIAAIDTSRTVSDWPDTTTDNGSSVSGGAGGATLAWCRFESAAASWDPTTFTISASDDWGTAVIAVRPAPARVPRFTSYPQLLAH